MGCKNSTIIAKGFTKCETCHCSGIYKEKYGGYQDYRLHIVAHSKFYLFKGKMLKKHAPIKELNQALSEI